MMVDEAGCIEIGNVEKTKNAEVKPLESLPLNIIRLGLMERIR
jgi:hypothetical protein